MSYISSLFAAGIEEVRKSWGWFFVCGIVLIALGAMCIVKDQTATAFSILALGWVLLISAVVWFVNSFQAWTWGGFFVYALNALIRGVTGYLLIRHPDAGASAVTMVLAVLFIVGGIFRVIGASSIQFPGGDGRRLQESSRPYSVSHFSLRGPQPAPTLSGWQSVLISSSTAAPC